MTSALPSVARPAPPAPRPPKPLLRTWLFGLLEGVTAMAMAAWFTVATTGRTWSDAALTFGPVAIGLAFEKPTEEVLRARGWGRARVFFGSLAVVVACGMTVWGALEIARGLAT